MKKNDKGFTLQNILFFVVIVGVVVLVLLPTIQITVEKAKEAVDIANVGIAVSKVKEAYLKDMGVAVEDSFDNEKTKELGTQKVIRFVDNNKIEYTMWVKLTQTKDGWQGLTKSISGYDIPGRYHGNRYYKISIVSKGMEDIGNAELQITRDN